MCAQNTDTADKDTKGFCFYKNTNGIKRHILVDVLGNPYFVKCTKASLSDDQGLIDIIQENQDFFLNLPENHVITILLDNGYHKDFLEKEIAKINPELLKFIKIEITEKITPEQKEKSKKRSLKSKVLWFKRSDGSWKEPTLGLTNVEFYGKTVKANYLLQKLR